VFTITVKFYEVINYRCFLSVRGDWNVQDWKMTNNQKRAWKMQV